MYIDDIVKKEFNSEEKNIYAKFGKTDIITNIINILCLLMVVISFFIKSDYKLFFVGILLIIILIINIFKKFKRAELENILKSKFVNRILIKKYINVSYDINAFVNKQLYINSQISVPFNIYKGSDYLIISKNNYKIEMCKLFTYNKGKTNNTNSNISFNGVFGRAILPYDFNENIAVVSTVFDYDPTSHSLFSNSFKIATIYENFNNKFTIFTRNKETINNFLSNEIQEYILKLYNNGIIINFSLINNILYFSVADNNFMKIPINYKYIDDSTINKDILLIDEILNFIEKFKNNLKNNNDNI